VHCSGSQIAGRVAEIHRIVENCRCPGQMRARSRTILQQTIARAPPGPLSSARSFKNPNPIEETVMELKGSKTEESLKAAFAGESQANRRYLYFAQKADVEGYNDVAAVFRSTAEGETGHAHGHLEYLEAVGDPATGLPIGATSANLKAAIAGETHEYTDMYPGMAKTARDEGFDEIADWFETLAKAERSHANRFRKALDNLET
jgi:rubrerythrin